MRFTNWIKDNLLSILIFLCTAIYILVYSLWCEPGISPDSTNYLREANALLRGYGFNNDAGAGINGHFTIWPIGYPALIALVSFITRLNVFYAAKLITIAILGATTYIFIKRFGKISWVYLLLLCNPGYVSCMRHVSSENLFFFAVMWFAFCLYDVWEGKVSENKACIKLCMASLMAVLSRWVGAFTLAPMGLIVLMTFFGIGTAKNRKKSYKLAGVTAFNGLFTLGYLICNKIITGYSTGMYRIPSHESKIGLIKALIKAEDLELYNALWGIISINNKVTVLVIALIIAFICYRIYKGRLEHKLPICFLVTSLIYWCGYVYTRFQTDMEMFNHRVLLPATIALFVSFVYCLMEYEKVKSFIESINDKWWRLLIASVIVVVLSFQLQLDSGRMLLGDNTYEKMVNHIDEHYHDIPSGSLVITEDWEINFLRMDLVRTSVNDCDADQLSDIMNQLQKDDFENIYVQSIYLDYLFMCEEDENSYPELRQYQGSSEYLIKLR